MQNDLSKKEKFACRNEHVKLSEKKTEDEFEIKGLSWLIYGEKQQNCKGQTLKFQNGNVNLLNEKTSQVSINSFGTHKYCPDL